MRKLIGAFMIIAAIGVIAFGGYTFYPKFADYREGQKLYGDLQDKYLMDPDDEGSFAGDATEVTAQPLEQATEGVSEEATQEETESAYVSAPLTKEQEGKIIQAIMDCGVSKRDAQRYLPLRVDHKALYKENKDYIGWIYVPGTKISYPVVASEDNVDYLHHNFAGNYNFPGTIFLDARCKDGLTAPYSIIYGHNMRDGSMFAGLKKFLKEDYAKKHPLFWMLTPDGNMLYQVYSLYTTTPADKAIFDFDREEISYAWEDAYLEKWKKLKENSLISTDVELKEEDQCLTMVTCTDDSAARNVVTGKVVCQLPTA